MADGSQYCPDANTTRGEMAAFIHRLSLSGVLNAGLLDGLDSTDFARAATGSGGTKAADSELLDGKDSTAFLGSAVEERQNTQPVAVGPATVTVDCLPGEQVTGGGFDAGAATLTVSASRPEGNGWHFSAEVTLAGDVTVYALCAPMGG